MNKSKGPLLNGILNFTTTFIHILEIFENFFKVNITIVGFE